MSFYDDLAQFGDALALITEDEELISYRALAATSDRICREIKDRSLVFCVCQNSYAALAGYLGFLRCQAVPILISDSLHDDLFHNLVQKYKPRYLWWPRQKGHHISNMHLIYSFQDYELLEADNPIKMSLHPELALLLTTSGSTGSPKLVRQSYKNIDSNARSIAEYLEISAKDRPITTMPMSYTYGLSIINSHLLRGASLILTDKGLIDKKFWDLLRSYEATTFGGVPFIYQILKKLRFEKMDLPSLKTLTQAGGKLGLELSLEFARICKQKGIAFIVMYGQTEATARMAYLPNAYGMEKAGSIGKAIPGGKFWLEDEHGNVIEANDRVGELIYQGDNVTMGYAENYQDLAKGDENKGVLRTGDMAMRDREGFYTIVGREKRFLKVYGHRINLDELEELLKTAGFDCACTGEDDHLQVFSTDKNDIEKIKAYMKRNIAINPGGLQIYYIESIPRSEAGKILYSELERIKN
jgi:long-chain acyl-CoA synthetase